MDNFFNHLKRILIALLTVIIVICSIPRFSIHSYAMGSTYALQQSVLYLTSYITSRGYSIAHAHGSDLPTVQELLEMNMDRQGQFLNDVAVRLDAFGSEHDLPDLGEQFINKIKAACFTGALILSPTVRDLVDTWLATSYSSSINGVSLGTTTTSISNFASPAGTTFEVETYSQTGIIQCMSRTIPITLQSSANSSSGSVIFLPEDIESFSYNALNNTYTFQIGIASYNFLPISITYNNSTYKTYYSYFAYGVPDFLHFTQLTYNGSPTLEDVFRAFLSGQYEEVEGGQLVSTRLTDTSNTDVLTSGNEIEQDGSVSGSFVLYLPETDTLIDLINEYNAGSITYDDFIDAIGLSTVSSDATVSEKQQALSEVAVPDSTYVWITKTEWGSEAISETTDDLTKTHTEESSIADSIADSLKGENNSEDDNDKSRNKGLLALLLLGLGWWHTPIIAGDGDSEESDSGGTDDGSGGGSNPGYLAETIAGMSIAGGLVDDFFDAAGGSDGYGFIYTVGASFVIFSVVIGAANYFGALFHGSDTKQNVKPSAKSTKPETKPKKGN